MVRLPALFPDNTVAEAWPRLRQNWLCHIETLMLGTAPEQRAVRGKIVAKARVYGGEGIEETVRIRYGTRGTASFFARITRPARAGRFPVITWNQFTGDSACPLAREALARGFAIAAFEREQLWEDRQNGARNAKDAFGLDYTFGAIRAWALGHSMLLDYLKTRDFADTKGFIAIGHSRGGKAALAAGAFDERFSVTVANNSGCGGAGCFRALAGRDSVPMEDSRHVETLGRIASAFPYWWAEDFARYGGKAPNFPLGNEERLPFDLHTLKAMTAPRFLLTMEALDDTWSNPYGTYTTWRAAQPAFDLLSAGEHNAIVYRNGGHNMGAEDWRAALDFCDLALRAMPPRTRFNNAPFTA